MLWLVVIVTGLLTFGTRLSFIQALGQGTVPPRIQRALRLVPAAVLTAIITPEVFLVNGAPNLSLGNERLIAGALAALVAWRTRNIMLTVIVGMAALWLQLAFLTY
jgi:branched-subunit amino acid transport protein